MPLLDLSLDELLATTRSVRKRLDLSRPVEPELIRECLNLAVQAPTGANSQHWHFVAVTEPEQRLALGDLYRKGFALYRELVMSGKMNITSSPTTDERKATLKKVLHSTLYLVEHMHEVPVLVIPCVQGRVEGLSAVDQAGLWGSILPATWSFMLAARARGLGTCWTTFYLYYEREAAEVIGIPYEQFTQVALIPVAYTLGTYFKPAPRIPLESVLHWEKW